MNDFVSVEFHNDPKVLVTALLKTGQMYPRALCEVMKPSHINNRVSTQNKNIFKNARSPSRKDS